MIVGVPKEIKKNEMRVGLTPASVRTYVQHNHRVRVETGAGLGIGADDEGYRRMGADVVQTAAEVFSQSDLIVKVKEPQPSEIKQFREGQIIYAFLHLAPDPEQTIALLESGVTAIAYETITNDYGQLPLLAPMSEVAGRIAVDSAANSLKHHNGGKGILVGGVPGVAPAKINIIGGGVVGKNAAKMALGLGAQITILDTSLERLRELDDLFNGRVQTRYSTDQSVLECVLDADAVIGAVLLPGAAAPKLVSAKTITDMEPGSVIVDVAIDQGGCFETSSATTHADPTYTVSGVVHYCVSNMPGSVPRTSSFALNNATLDIGLRLANDGLDALRDHNLLNGLNVHAGKLTHRTVAESLNMAFSPVTF